MTLRLTFAAFALLGSLASVPAQAAMAPAAADRAEPAPQAAATADALVGTPATAAPKRKARVATSSMVESTEPATAQDVKGMQPGSASRDGERI